VNLGRFETVALGLLAIACCAGLPLLAAAGLSATLWLGGVTFGLAALAAVIALWMLRALAASGLPACEARRLANPRAAGRRAAVKSLLRGLARMLPV